ncbi:hypothetical protein [Dielma fastidiosa]|uniref:Uncharacterized protein n=1 Tax=Dielma fastidiosa TaxID=1034346 RepID=A0A318L2I6_9FIRM|nr:hypothetical protein [Dielma fastidiosa]PXX79713.1 hypothetical protein DES51_105187 [Dielma fastidiosa]
MRKIKRFADVNQAAKVRRLNQIMRLVTVPDKVNMIYNYYNKNSKDEQLLYLMREIILKSIELPANLKDMLV